MANGPSSWLNPVATRRRRVPGVGQRLPGSALLLAVLWGVLRAAGQDFNGDGKADILWRNKATGANVIWLMNRTALVNPVTIQVSADLNWRIAGSGFFNPGTGRDILWQHALTGQKAVWFMNGTQYQSSALVTPDTDPAWKVAGTGDFNGDGKSDLVWQHDTTGEKAIWLMNGTALDRAVVVDTASGTDWRIAAVGSFAGDSTPDIVLRHVRTGQVSIWTMAGTGIATGTTIDSIIRPDMDWQLVGAEDFNGDGKTDLLWRHATIGFNLVTLMNGLVKGSEVNLDPAFDTDWRVATQEMADSRYRIAIDYGTQLEAVAGAAPPRISLKCNIPLASGQTMTVHRRLAGAADWGSPLAANLSSPVYVDSAVTVGQRYEYQVSFSGTTAAKCWLTAGIDLAPVEDRGRLVLLVDAALVKQSTTTMNAALTLLQEDLAGDGWTVVRKDVPRHDDRANEAANAVNKQNLAAIRSMLKSEQAAGAKGVFIVGHVTIPYSGYHNADGHGTHIGAWPADMVYGDVDDGWTDSGQVIVGTTYPENENVPGDGKFDNDFAPSNLEMFVGRVDFSRLPAFKTGNSPTSAEAGLVQKYFEKTHRYRFQQSPYPLPEAGVAYSSFTADGRRGVDTYVYENAQRNLAAFFSGGTGKLVVGDPFLQKTRRFRWGFAGGPGAAPAINAGMGAMEHSSLTLANPQNEPPIGFHLLLGSYFGDWNMTNVFMKAVLATANYGLAVAWICPNPTPTRWRLQGLAMGAPIGTALPATVNDNPPQLTGDNGRYLALLGDPTLRLHTVVPPQDVVVVTEKNTVRLSWSAGEAGARYFVYRGVSRTGPFARISPAPIDGTSFVDDAPVKREKFYLVRALKAVVSGAGSYTNLSQGVIGALR